MWNETPFTHSLGVRLPIIAAPMAGGPTTPALVAEASAAGGFGVLGAGYQSPDALRSDIREVRARTDAAFGVNLFVPAEYEASPGEMDAALRLLTPYATQLGIELVVPDSFGEDFVAQLGVTLDERVPFVSFTFGVPEASVLAAVREAAAICCGTATSLAEARALSAAGVDMICVQGGEAGGHRGGFIGDPEQSAVGLMALLPAVCNAVDVPVIAAGGIMDGSAIAATLTLGAAAAQLGTAFLLTPEAGTNAPYRAALEAASDTDTVLTRAFSGKPARGIRNRMTDELATVRLPPYPVMNGLTRALRQAAVQRGAADYLSLWAGQGVAQARALPVRELVSALVAETESALRQVRS